MHYEVFIRTRDFKTDYQWIGKQPEEWWKGHPAAGLVINQKGILRVGDKWLITGIPTGKSDSIGTTITKDVVYIANPSGTTTENDLYSLIDEYYPNWKASPNTLLTENYMVSSPLLNEDVKEQLRFRDSATASRALLAQNDGGGLVKARGAGGGGCAGMIAAIGVVALSSTVILREAKA